MARDLVRVRMLRHVAQFVQVLDLEMGEVYELTAEKAEQFVANGMAERVDTKGKRLEAAALGDPQRRG
jgi:hypothetical protein